MFRIITISREYGSGGGSIAAALAARLDWRLFDRAFVSEVARMAHVDPDLARAYDERVDSWLHRVAKQGLWHGAFEHLATVSESDFFDSDTMAALSTELIGQAADAGQCVIVGRGAQCLLQKRADTFQVFIHAPLRERLDRLRTRLGERHDLEELARSVDLTRGEYIKARYGCNWKEPHLYDMMISSGLGEENVVNAIIAGAGLPHTQPRP